MKHRFYILIIENAESFSDFVAFQAAFKLGV